VADISIEQLEWDSSFFGFLVGKIDFRNINKIDKLKLKRQLKRSNFRLVYLFADPLHVEVDNAIRSTGAIDIDKKIILAKNAEKHPHFSNQIIEFLSAETSDELNSLALTAGNFSRFKIDNNFTEKEFERLYTEWILRSVRKEIAQKVFVAINNSKITGLITLEVKDFVASIGLLAVDEHYLGKKIGYDLVCKVDNEAYALGCKILTVATQFQNIPAIKLYQKCGFSIVEKINVFHYWNHLDKTLLPEIE
jgi:dTDP-4-amino-4,6-dideoxy-D-galactose acyltransferase